MTIGSHQSCVGKSHTHLTPRHIIDALGPFDLDPCAAPEPRPWATAAHHIALPDDGLAAPWAGRVWLNPPFDRYSVGQWIRRLADHGNGICLLHARTETDWFEPVWQAADVILFLASRIKFCRQDGTPHEANSGAPVILAAFGPDNMASLANSGIDGHLVWKWSRAGEVAE